MSDQDHNDEDATELAIDVSDLRDDTTNESTNPLRSAAPDELRRRFLAKLLDESTVDEDGGALDFDPEVTRERSALPNPPAYLEEGYDEDKTSVAPLPRRNVTGAQPAQGKEPPRPGLPLPPNPARGSGPNPGMRQSGANPAPHQSGANPAVRQSGANPVPQSGANPGLRQSGAIPSVRQSGANRAVHPSGPNPAVRQSGANPAVRQSGANPAVRQSGANPAVHQSGPNPAVRQSAGLPAIGGARSQPFTTSEATAPGANELQPKSSGHAGLELPEVGGAPDADAQLRRLGLSRRKAPNANSVKPNSGFYSLPAANPGEMVVEATVEHVFVDEDKKRATMGLVVAILAGTATAVALLAVALGQWVSPGAMMAWTLLAMVLLAGIVAGISLPEEALRVDGMRKAFLPMGIAVAFTLISGLVWQVGSLRAQLRWIAAETPELSRSVLMDPSSAVYLPECELVANNSEVGAWREVLEEVLIERKELGAQCLQTLSPEASDTLQATLADRWFREVLETREPERACGLADALTRLERPDGDIEMRLLSCVLKAPSARVQDCCGISLAGYVAGSDEWVDSLTKGDRYLADEAMAVGLMTFAFHQEGISGAQKEFIESSKFTGNKARRTALTVACDAVEQGVGGLSKHFAASLDSSCPIDVAKVPTGREVWLSACDVAEAQVANGVPPVKALCEATKSALVTAAVTDASRILGNAAKDRTAANDLAIAIEVEGTRKQMDRPLMFPTPPSGADGSAEFQLPSGPVGVEAFRQKMKSQQQGMP